MKLRKAAKNALLDLDDPLETDSDNTYSEYEYLSDVNEEDEDGSENDGGEEQGNKEDDDEHVSDEASELDASASDGASIGGEESASVGHPLNNLKSGSDANDGEELTQRQGAADNANLDEGDEEAGSSGVFNPFTLLTDHSSDRDDRAEDHHASSHRAASGATGEPYPGDVVAVAQALASGSDDEADAAWAGEGADDAQPPAGRVAQRRRRKQRRNSRRRRRGAAVAEGAPGDMECVSSADAGEGAALAGSTAALPAQEAEAAVNAVTSTPPGPPSGEGGSASASRDVTGAGDVGRASQPCCDGEAPGSPTAGSDGDEREGGIADCWLCYGEGRIIGHEPERRPGCGGLSDSHAAAGSGGGDAAAVDGSSETELVAPCRVCAGGLRYIHRGCFGRWLESSWALACPNCRTMYDSTVLDAFGGGPSVSSMLAASCPPDHDPRQPFPHGTRVHFCVGGMVELSLACGGLTAVELLRRIRLMVDDMAARGGDGGLGLEDESGRTLQLPSFNVTGLVLDVRHSDPGYPWGSQRGWLPGLMSGDDDSDDDDEGEFWRPPRAAPAGDAGRHGHRDPTVGYADSDAEYYYDSDSGDSDDRAPDRVGAGVGAGGGAGRMFRMLQLAAQSQSQPQAPPAARRDRSFTSGSMSATTAYMDRLARSRDDRSAPSALVGLERRRTMLGGNGLFGADGMQQWMAIATAPSLEMWRPQLVAGTAMALPLAPPVAPVPPFRDYMVRHEGGAVRSAADRAVLRAVQMRQRADLQLQQRNQQRHGVGSRGHQAMPGGSRARGGRRR